MLGDGPLHQHEPGPGQSLAGPGEIGPEAQGLGEGGEGGRGIPAQEQQVGEIGVDHGIGGGELERPAEGGLGLLAAAEGEEREAARVPRAVILGGRVQGA